MGGAPFPSLIGELQRRHCFRRGMLRNAARARFTPTPGVATPLSHATPSPAVARRPSSSAVTVAVARSVVSFFSLSTSAELFRQDFSHLDEVSLLLCTCVSV